MGEPVGGANGHTEVDHHQTIVAQLAGGLVEGGDVRVYRLIGDREHLVQVVDGLAVVLGAGAGSVLLVLAVF